MGTKNKKHKHWYLAAALVAVFLGVGVWSGEGSRFPIAPPSQVTSVWLVRCLPNGTGSGFPVARQGSLIGFLTAKHVAERGVSTVELRGSVGKVQTIEVHPTLDVALLWAEGLPADVRLIPLRLTAPRLGEPIFGAGYALGSRLAITFGFVGDPVSTGTSATIYGFSGGPVMQPNGTAIGVAVGIMVVYNTPIASFSDFVPVSSIEPWLWQRGVL